MGGTIDPVVVALAIALTSRQPVARLLGAEHAGNATCVAPATVAAPRSAVPRSMRPKNRKG